MDRPSSLPECLPCRVCDPDLGLKTKRECTPTSDTVCGPLDHHYCTKTDKGCTFARKHTICRPGQFIIYNRTTLTNTECGYCPHKTFSNEYFSAYCKPHRDCQSLGLTAGTNTSDSECGPRNIPVYIVIVPVLLALAVILAIIFILRSRRQNMAREKYFSFCGPSFSVTFEEPDLICSKLGTGSDEVNEGLQGGLEPIPACGQEAGIHPGPAAIAGPAAIHSRSHA
ncbi:tumor necrosis factor receptor superfamily member 14-like [Anguilla rostrata]|uniref:tumor necrosis factor receptor superfamily member 14-like n=1 Tax=Anguilla rostrata TaxID=7938 RepID=UPI0030CF8D53